VFNQLATKILDKKSTKSKDPVAISKQKLVIVDEPVQTKKKSGCC
jgi:hypothetical protein